MTIGAIIWLFVRPRTFIGKLTSKTSEITFTYDEESLSVNSDGEIELTGEDETIAYKTYRLQFYVDGRIEDVFVNQYAGKTPNVKREDLALQELSAVDIEPPEWTHAKENADYLVKTSCGILKDITPLITIKIE